MVTDLRFVETGDQLLSSSKDSLVKLWDLQTQHCVETLVGHRSEVWSIDLKFDFSSFDLDLFLIIFSSSLIVI